MHVQSANTTQCDSDLSDNPYLIQGSEWQSKSLRPAGNICPDFSISQADGKRRAYFFWSVTWCTIYNQPPSPPNPLFFAVANSFK